LLREAERAAVFSELGAFDQQQAQFERCAEKPLNKKQLQQAAAILRYCFIGHERLVFRRSSDLAGIER
jgi:hypothetical protein